MGLLDKLKSKLRDDWCAACSRRLEPEGAPRIYSLPMTVGQYRDHTDPAYYLKNLRPVSDVTAIPSGQYACRITVLRCSGCGCRRERLVVFLPVRGEEKFETAHFFEKDELGMLIEDPYQQP